MPQNPDFPVPGEACAAMGYLRTRIPKEIRASYGEAVLSPRDLQDEHGATFPIQVSVLVQETCHGHSPDS